GDRLGPIGRRDHVTIGSERREPGEDVAPASGASSTHGSTASVKRPKSYGVPAARSAWTRTSRRPCWRCASARCQQKGLLPRRPSVLWAVNEQPARQSSA